MATEKPRRGHPMRSLASIQATPGWGFAHDQDGGWRKNWVFRVRGLLPEKSWAWRPLWKQQPGLFVASSLGLEGLGKGKGKGQALQAFNGPKRLSWEAMGNALALRPGSRSGAPRREEARSNPGSFDELHRKCKEVFPQQMEGVKLIINKSFSSHFQVTHTIHMSTIGQSSYHFSATYVGDQQLNPAETFPTLVGDINNTGSLNAQVLYLLAEQIRTKAVFQTQQSKFVTWQFDTEYRGDDYTATLTLGNPNVINESIIVVAHFLQSVTSRLVLGGEMVYHRRLGEEGAIVTLAGKYTALKWIATLNLGYGGAHASYYHQANDQIQVGVEFEANTRLQDTSFAFGYQLTLPKTNMVFRGFLDSSWCVGAILEKKLPPLPVTLALGAFLNHWKHRFHCGFSIIVG